MSNEQKNLESKNSELKNILVGFDLCNDYSQISYFDQKVSEPESIYLSSGSCLIPTLLFIKAETKEWFYGEEAITLAKDNEGVLVEDIVKRIEDHESIEVMGAVIEGSELLVKFIRKSLSLVKVLHPTNTILKLMFTVQNLNNNLIEAIYDATRELNLLRDRVFVQSHGESALYYMLSQNKELWLNDVGIFDFNYKGISFYQITTQKKYMPYISLVQRRDFYDENNDDYIQFINQEEYDKLDIMFEMIAKEAIGKQIFTSIYLTGNEFPDDQCSNTLQFLCIGRRVFKGRNLYTKGACYAANELTKCGDGIFKDYIIVSEGRIDNSIEIKADINNTERSIELIKAGETWKDANCSIDLILKEGNTIELLIKNILTKDTIRELITLDGLINRPMKTSRIGLSINFIDEETCIINCKDKGFGEMYPTTNRVWEKIIKL